jgi:murein DD-endopeptidase MepM/ murein hydrolase activator NlpD
MTKPLRGRFIMLLIIAPSALGIDNQALRFPGGTEVEIVAPVLEPGQIILARLMQGPDVKKFSIRFGDAVYELGPREQALEAFALIGLDLGLKPGPYDLEMTVFLRDGRAEKLKHRVLVGDRDFPVKKLWVKEEFVRPPPEVQDRIQREAEILEMVYSVSSRKWLGEGLFERPHPGEMTPNFGEKRIYNNVPRSTHSGVDIAAPYGSPVRASNAGRVVLARDLYFSGKTVIIDHGLGLFTFYCHFSRLQVSRGDMVKKGAVIALAGSTGRSTGPHLHWGVKLLGSRVDPGALLSLALPE